MVRTRFPKCSKCDGAIDPNKDKFRVVNLEEAKYGRAPVYAHEACPARASEAEQGFEATMAGIAVGDLDPVRPGDGDSKPR